MVDSYDCYKPATVHLLLPFLVFPQSLSQNACPSSCYTPPLIPSHPLFSRYEILKRKPGLLELCFSGSDLILGLLAVGHLSFDFKG